MDKIINRDYNAAAKVFLGLGMLATVITIINSFLMIGNYRNFGLDIPKTLVPEIIIDFLRSIVLGILARM